jgi:hypothetical protein
MIYKFIFRIKLSIMRNPRAKRPRRPRHCKIRSCGVTTRAGKPCKICLAQGKTHCWYHGPRAKLNKIGSNQSGIPACYALSSKPPTVIQKCVLDFIGGHKQFAIFLGVGTGKTNIGVIAANCYLAQYPQNKVYVVAPAALVSNFTKELQGYGIPPVNPRIHVYSFERFIKEAPSCHNVMMIVDEAHNLRTPDSARFKALMRCAGQADKRILMTATPFVNAEQDVMSLASLLSGDSRVSNLQDAFKHLEQNVLFMERAPGSEQDFPETIVKRIFIKMSPGYEREYMKLLDKQFKHKGDFKDPKKFLHGLRKAGNRLESAKPSAKLSLLARLIGNKKAMIYSNWLSYGIKAIGKELSAAGISHKLYHGSITPSHRAEMLHDFNTDKYQTLVVSGAGGTGIDTKGVRVLLLVDPPWNYATLQQIQGRVARFKSHAHLPPLERNVEIYQMVLVTSAAGPDPEIGWQNDLASGDALLYKMIDAKQIEGQKIQRELERISIKC